MDKHRKMILASAYVIALSESARYEYSSAHIEPQAPKLEDRKKQGKKKNHAARYGMSKQNLRRL